VPRRIAQICAFPWRGLQGRRSTPGGFAVETDGRQGAELACSTALAAGGSSMSDVRERLRRVLFLVPYASRHPGITVRELAQALGLSEEELLVDLDLLTMVGRPPFQPDDYIDVYVENGRVYLDLDQRFSAPPRLTAAEAAALRAAADLVRP